MQLHKNYPSRDPLSQGTTGLISWQGAMLLSAWSDSFGDSVLAGKRVLELGMFRYSIQQQVALTSNKLLQAPASASSASASSPGKFPSAPTPSQVDMHFSNSKFLRCL